MLERRGVQIVGEDHDEGGRAAATVPLDLADTRGALVSLHHGAPQCPRRIDPNRRIAEIERSVGVLDVDVLMVVGTDAATSWLLPDLRRLAARVGCAIEFSDGEAAVA